MASLTAPPTLPQYIADGLPKQDDETLRDAREFIDELLTAREQRHQQRIGYDELPANTEIVEEHASTTVYREYRTCGDDTCACMSGGAQHGPYRYRAYRDGDTVRREYLGKATNTENDNTDTTDTNTPE